LKKKPIIITLILCIIFAAIASLIASSHPDGLEWAAEHLGFLSASEGQETITSPMPDYIMPWIRNKCLSSTITAALGTLFVFLIILGIGRLIKRK